MSRYRILLLCCVLLAAMVVSPVSAGANGGPPYTLTLVDEVGNPLANYPPVPGTLSYKYRCGGSWAPSVSFQTDGSGQFVVNPTCADWDNKVTVTLNQTSLEQDVTVNPVFQAAKVNANLKSCTGPITATPGGTVAQGGGYWYTHGTTGPTGTLSFHTFPATLTLRITYNHHSLTLYPVIVAGVNQVDFQTTKVTLNHPEDIRSNKGGSWWYFSQPSMDLLPGDYPFYFKTGSTWNGPVIITVSGCEVVYPVAAGQIIVDKVTLLAGDPQLFTFTPSWGAAFQLADATAPADSGPLAPGSYSVSEAVPAGWDATSAVCVAAPTGAQMSPAAITLGAGETVTCTFTNTKRGQIIIDKATLPAGDPQSFTFTPSWGAAFQLADATAPHDSGLLAPGSYSVAETVPAGWTLTSAVCSDGSPANAISLQAGETVTCTFTNTKQGAIYVDKVTLPAGDPQSFTFTPSWGATFQLADATTPADSGILTPGTYSVTETVPAGWDLTGVSCSDPDGGTVVSLATQTVTFDLDPGESIGCTFTNTKRGQIIIDKATLPAGDPQLFTFTPSWGATFQLADATAPADSGPLAPGPYSVLEAVPAGWDATSAVCVAAPTGAQMAPAAITLGAGETVTCTFTNTKRGQIIVQKVTDPTSAVQRFEFAPSWGANFFLANGQSNNSGLLVPGPHSVVETVPAGWTLTSAICSDGSPANAISLQAGETVTCTFTNTLQRGEIIVDKLTVPAGHAQVFNFRGSWGLPSGTDFQLTDVATPYRSGPLLPGITYSVAEAVPAGWDLTDVTCRVTSGPGAGPSQSVFMDVNPKRITLGAGETVTCSFTNTLRPGRIIVDKVTDPAGDPTSFEFDPSWGANFFLTDAGAPVSSLDLMPGTYSVAEIVPGGWALLGATCSDQSSASAISLDPDETVTCTFRNFRIPTGSLTIIKDASPGDGTVFSFTGSMGAFTLSDPTNPSRTAGGVGGQALTVTEGLLPADWLFGGVSCNAGSWIAMGQTVTVYLGRDESASCTFYNNKQGRILVDKVTNPAGSAQQFEFDPSWGASFFLSDAAALADSGLLPPGRYSVAEVNLPAGWTLTGATCSDGSDPVAISLQPGETVTCTFYDYQARGHIIIDKVTHPAGSIQQFEFHPSWGANFMLTDTGAPADSGELLPGTYSVAEIVPAGWELTEATCSDQSDPSAISLQPGETVTCTFTNTQWGRILVDKVTDPAGSLQEFEFDPSWGANFMLTDGAAPADSGLLPPGRYSVAEVNLPAGWTLTGAACSDQSDPAAISLEPGEVITCTFINTQRGRILVDKVTDPAGSLQEFEFDPSWGANFFTRDVGSPHDSGYLVPGSYSVAEVNLPAGWTLTGATCSDQSDPSAISLQAGEVVTCTFTNFNPPEGSITIIKEALPLDATGENRPFGFSGDLGSFVLRDPADPSRTFASLDPGLYTVTEDALSGSWQFSQVTCNGGASVSFIGQSVIIDLAQGESVICTFENFEEEVLAPTASLTIVKEATPADDTAFAFDGGMLGTFTLKDPSDPSVTFTELEAGTYVITELDPTGDWGLAGVECIATDWSVAGNTVTVVLAEGEAATCTFSNEGELPFTGVSPNLLPLLAAGWAALALGLTMLLLARRRARA